MLHAQYLGGLQELVLFNCICLFGGLERVTMNLIIHMKHSSNFDLWAPLGHFNSNSWQLS